MRIETLITLAGEAFQANTSQIALGEHAVGLAELRTHWGREKALPTLGIPLRIALGLADTKEPLVQVFMGVLADVLRLDGDEAQFTGRCAAAALDLPAHLSLYAPTPADVLRKVEGACGLPLLLPQKAPYLTQRVPRFVSLGSGREALDSMCHAWGIEDAGWWALPDGRVFWGQRQHTPFYGRALSVPRALIGRHQPDGRLRMVANPHWRPGMRLALNGTVRRIVRVLHFPPHTELQW